jgi:GDP-fucose protein O-fucosyltransferase
VKKVPTNNEQSSLLNTLSKDEKARIRKMIESDMKSTAKERLAVLNCSRYGGPSIQDAQEMVYWQHIPSDALYVSPFRRHKGLQNQIDDNPQYMTFEPDGGGWNNIRMAMETVVGLAIATGRTLVLPPHQRMYLLAKGHGKQKTEFSFQDFFPMDELRSKDLPAIKMVTMQEFLEKEAMTGNMRDIHTGAVTYPPFNLTDWSGKDVVPLKEWLRNATLAPLWAPGHCMAAFPASSDPQRALQLTRTFEEIVANHMTVPEYMEDPTPVDASPRERMIENRAKRMELCMYNETMQSASSLHFMCYHKMRVRMLVHFYAFLFFEDWREDLWLKRFMRDHMRYIDEIQCAAARVVAAVRQKSREAGHADGAFDSFHVRRGDFQYKNTRVEATEIHEVSKDKIASGSVVFISTDERNKQFFEPLQKFYKVYFLDDFKTELEGINTNYYGMIDQLVASRGRVFFGCYYSTYVYRDSPLLYVFICWIMHPSSAVLWTCLLYSHCMSICLAGWLIVVHALVFSLTCSLTHFPLRCPLCECIPSFTSVHT